MRRFGLIAGLVILAAAAGLVGCAATRLPNVPYELEAGRAATPPVLGPFGADSQITSAQEWTQRRAPLLRAAFQHAIYGAWPKNAAASVRSRTILEKAAFGGLGQIEQWDVGLSGIDPIDGFSLIVVLPVAAAKPAPIVVMENFCGNKAVFPDLEGVAGPRHGVPKECANPLMSAVAPLIFGDAIVEPPLADILRAGFGVAMMYGGDIVPDEAEAAPPYLAALTPQGTPPEERTGAVAAWAWGYLRAVDVLAGDARIDAQRIVLWGHSRNGKAALLAAAMDPRPAAVIALQSGKAGASLHHQNRGETIAQVTKSYPHWFAPAFARFADRQDAAPVDQHQLLALIAPRSVLLGGARRDSWSDPQGAVAAARGAAPVYALYGAGAFSQSDLRGTDFAFPIVTYVRLGLHGVHGSDWAVALSFLDKRLPAQAPVR